MAGPIRFFHQCGGICCNNASRLRSLKSGRVPIINLSNKKNPPLKAGRTGKSNSSLLDPQGNHHHHHHHHHQEEEGGKSQIQNHLQQEQELYLQAHHHQQQQQDPSHLFTRTDLTQLKPPQPPSHKKRSYQFPPPPYSSTTTAASTAFAQQATQYARKMGEAHHQNQAAATSSRLGILKNTGGGEIVEVQGGHIVRSIGRKDRHSKVCTAKGPRDRRVRLSAHTAIQFYDVQDRLGLDRPSKAVDWLIKKAKSSIDELAKLPPWNPEILGTAINTDKQEQTTTTSDDRRDSEHQFHIHHMGSEVQNLHHRHQQHQEHQQQQQQQQTGENPNNNSSSSSFLPPSLDSDSIADTIKSFFPMGASTGTQSSSIQFQSYPPDFLSRTSSQSQDLRLSLQSFQEPMLLHHHHNHNHHHHHHHQAHQSEPVLFSEATPLGFDGGSSTGWEQHHPVEIGRFQRMVAWNSGGDTGSGGGGVEGGGGFIFNSPPPLTPPLHPLFGQNNQLFSQRGPLQSSNTPSIRAWIDQPITAMHDHHHHQIPQTIHQSAISGIGFASSSGGFSGYRIPARIQGDEEEHDGIPNKPSSASSDSRH